MVLHLIMLLKKIAICPSKQKNETYVSNKGSHQTPQFIELSIILLSI